MGFRVDSLIMTETCNGRKSAVLDWITGRRMKSVRQVAASNAQNPFAVSLVVHVQERDGRSANRRQSCYSQTFTIPGEMVAPSMLTRVENRGIDSRGGIGSHATIATTFVAVSASQGKILGFIAAGSRLWNDVIQRKQYKLPALVGMAVFTAQACAFTHHTPHGG
jgi:hypothetical protein